MSSNILSIFDSSEIEGISALIDKLEESSFDYLKLESGEFSIIIGKNGACETPAVDTASGVNSIPSQISNESVSIPATLDSKTREPITGVAADVGVGGAEASAPASAAAVPIIEQEGIFIIRSPSYGLFYAQSEPGSPPYVTVGAIINADDTIGLMEIMKTFTAITSPVAGEVVAIHVKNEETLEPDQPLVSVRI